MSAYEEFSNSVKTKRINTNGKDVSDIIICRVFFGVQVFYNSTSHKIAFSLKKATRPGKRYLIFNRSKKHGKYRIKNIFWPVGFYIWHDKESGLLYFIGVRLSKRLFKYYWKETSRNAYHKDTGYMFKSNEEETIFPYYAFDICGQSLIPNIDSSKNLFSLYTNHGFSGYMGNRGYYSASKETMLSYLGGTVMYNGKVLSFDQPLSYDIFFYRKGRKMELLEFTLAENLDINDSAKERLKSLAENTFNSCFNSNGQLRQVPSCWADYIVFEDSNIVNNLYQAIYLFDGLSKDSVKIGFMNSSVVSTLYPEYDFREFIIGRGEFPEPIKHITCFIDDWLKILDSFSFLKNSREGLTSANCDMANDVFHKKYGVESHYIPYLTLLFKDMPVVEKIYNVKCNNKHFKQDFLKTLCLSTGYTCNHTVEKYFGGLVEGKNLHQSLQLPKGFLEYMIDNNRYKEIKSYRDVFSSNEENIKYFMRMNKADFEELTVNNIASNDIVLGNMEKILSMYGAVNWRSYLDNMKQVVKNGVTGIYTDYIYMLSETKELIPVLPWKINTRDEIDHVTELLIPVYYGSECNEENETYLSLFEEQYSKWGYYVYQNDEYMITYPKKPASLVIEGAILHHCVGNFIADVAEGNTMILFVRRTDAPDKPFFTLEIRDNEIRQCHGFDNKNVPQDSGLSVFLKDFCREKGVMFSYGSKALAV